MEPIQLGYLSIAFLLLLLALGIHVAVALTIVGVGGFVLLSGPKAGFVLLQTTPYSTTSSFSFMVIPMFILMGQLANYGGLSEDVFATCRKWLGRLPGGLAMATTASCAAFAAACGSSIATCVTFTKIALPEMLKSGYDKRLATGAIAASGDLASMIPPSGLLVLYGIITEQSIGRLLMAGVIPGVMEAVMYMALIYAWGKTKPRMAPLLPETPPWRDRVVSLGNVWGIVALSGMVLGGIYTGVTSPTEAGAFGAFGALLLVIVRRRFSKKQFIGGLRETAATTVVLFAIMIGALIFSKFIAATGLGPQLVDSLTAQDFPRYLILAMILMLYIVLGTFLDPGSMMFLTLPIVFPVVQGLGFDGVWFGVIMIKLSEIGLCTPPVGLDVYAVHSAAEGKVDLGDVFQGVVPFLGVDLIQIGLLVAFPQIVLWLPGTMFG